MSVLDQRYRRWQGVPTPYWKRILVISHHDARAIFARKAWAAFYVLSLLPPLVMGAYVYFAVNAAKLAAIVPLLKSLSLPLPGAEAWEALTYLQLWLVLGFAVLAGPPIAARDFANNAMPLYLSKALRRFEYVLGRWLTLAVLLSAATWLPLCVVLGFEIALAPSAWCEANARLLPALFVATLPAVLFLTALISAVAAHVHRTNLARAAVLGVVMLTWPLGASLERATGTPLAQVVSPMAMILRVNTWAFEPPASEPARPVVDRRPGPEEPVRQSPLVPVPLAFLVLAAWIGGCVAVLAARVRPVEVVR